MRRRDWIWLAAVVVLLGVVVWGVFFQKTVEVKEVEVPVSADLTEVENRLDELQERQEDIAKALTDLPKKIASAMPEMPEAVVVVAEEPSPPATSTPAATPAPTQAASFVCPDKAVRVEPQGVWQSDGSFIAAIGGAGCVTVFEGRIWESGKGIQPRHDIVMIDGAKDNFPYWEGNGWTIPNNWSPQEFACLLWEGKQENWQSQGITPLPVKFWGFDPNPVCK